MKNPIRKIALILILIILLPALMFSLYEISTLNETEEVIEETYNNQLEAILFSVNQYSEDIVSNWRSKINLLLTEETTHPEHFKRKADSLLNINKAILSVFFFDSLNSSNLLEIYSDSAQGNSNIDALAVQKLIENNAGKVKRLFTYKRAGYNKIEPIEGWTEDSSAVLVFLLDDPTKIRNICVLEINPIRFVHDVLGTKIKEIAGEEFIITCSEINSADFIFTSDYAAIREIQQKKNLWIVPNYELGILLRGETIEGLVKERSKTGIIFISLLIVILFAGVFIVFRNIKKEMELAKIKSDFVSNVSHELRTPLALISMFAETLEMGRVKNEEKKQEYYSIISKEAGRLSRIVNKILSFSRIEAGKREYHFSSVDVNQLVRELYNSYQFHLQSSGFKFTFMPGEINSIIRADSEAVSEAIINLIDNAVKYSGDKKEINISTGTEDTNIFIKIEDKGIGISEENQRKIFEKFFRVSEGLVHNTRGTGLGLTLVKHIMDAHKGKIKVLSKINEGSTFILNFPIDNIHRGNK
jgi:two-component system phosphate regulon sensor histidine kinase PhoR